MSLEKVLIKLLCKSLDGKLKIIKQETVNYLTRSELTFLRGLDYLDHFDSIKAAKYKKRYQEMISLKLHKGQVRFYQHYH